MKKVAEFLTGFNAVVLGLIVFVVYRYFEVQSLFYRYLPLEENIRFLASCLVSLVVVFSLLVFSSHIDRFKLTQGSTGDWVKWMMFLFTLFINAFFWRVWDPNMNETDSIENGNLVLVFKAVTTLFFGVFDFAYNHLFISKWYDSQLISNASQTVAKLNQGIAKLKQVSSKLEQSISDREAKLSQVIAKDDPKVCPRCGQTFESFNQRNGHLRGCKIMPQAIINSIN